MEIDEYLDAAKAALRCCTDTQLALRLGARQSCISNYRTGRTLPNLEMARRIASVLNMRSGALIEDIRKARKRAAADRGRTSRSDRALRPDA